MLSNRPLFLDNLGPLIFVDWDSFERLKGKTGAQIPMPGTITPFSFAANSLAVLY
jgi:hypothetical protein